MVGNLAHFYDLILISFLLENPHLVQSFPAFSRNVSLQMYWNYLLQKRGKHCIDKLPKHDEMKNVEMYV